MDGKKILLVDNNPIILKLLSRILTTKSCIIKTAEDGLSALTSLKTFHPDILITDLIMPNIDGEQLCRIVRTKKEFQDTVIIILSAIAAEENFDFQSVGADACIAKGPVEEMGRNIQTAYSSVNKDLPPEILGTDTVFKRQITTELLIKKRHFEITLESIEDGFFELTPSRKITFCNSKGCLFFNSNQEQILSSDFLDLFSGKQRHIIEENFITIQQSPVIVEKHAPIKINDRFLRLKIIPVKNENENCILVLIRDITRQKHHEREIELYTHHLEEMVKKRTAEKDLVNEALKLKIVERENINEELQDALSKVKLLSGIIPICAHCKKIRDDKGYWNQVECYIRENSEAEFSHGICPECFDQEMAEINKLQRKK